MPIHHAYTDQSFAIMHAKPDVKLPNLINFSICRNYDTVIRLLIHVQESGVYYN